MNTCTTEAPKVAGIHELAREHLTTLCDEFLDGDPVRIVSAWRLAERMDPEDLADSYEGSYGLRLRVIDDLGCERAEAGCCERDCYEAFAALRLAYGKDWPRDALRDYCTVFEGIEASEADVIASLRWDNARGAYDIHKFCDGKPEKKAA